MKLANLVSAVNAARARADFVYFKSLEFQKGIGPSDVVQFLFDGQIFQTEVPYRIRFTSGVVISELNRGCFLVEDGNLTKVKFGVDQSGEVFWTV